MKKKFKISPYLMIMISFFLVILTGALLLMLPISITESYKQEINASHLTFIDALFTSATSVCVTGLSVIPNVGAGLTLFGKIVMLILIEIGGLSILTITMFIFILLGKKIGIASRFMMKEALNQNSVAGVARLVKYIIAVTFIFQGFSALVNFFIFKFTIPDWNYNFMETVGISIFHSVSSFNNAGLDIFGDSNSLINYSDNILLNINTMFSIIVGGIGFIVIHDVLSFRKTKRLSIHTKIVLTTTVCLIIGGGVILKLVQSDMTLMQAFFQSVSARTCGFATYDISKLNKPAQMLMNTLMLIGASPCSTGGGIKTTTLFVTFIFMISFAKGKTPVYGYRRISEQSILKAFSLLVFVVTYLAIIIFFISLFEPEMELNKIVFETISAFGTVGLSMGITCELSTASKALIILTMYLGRIGPLTVTSLLNKRWMRDTKDDIEYIEEKVIIG